MRLCRLPQRLCASITALLRLVSYMPLARDFLQTREPRILGTPEPKNPYLAPYVPAHQCCCLALQEMPPRKHAYRGAVVGGPRCPIRVRKDDEMTVDTTTPRELGLRIKKEDGTFFDGAARIEFRIKAGEHKAGKKVDLTCALIEGERVPMKPLRTVNGLEVRGYMVDFDRDAERARNAQSASKVGTVVRASDWYPGVPEDVQALLEAAPVDEEALLQIFRARYVGPSQFRVLQNCHLRHCDFLNRWKQCGFHFGSKGAAKGAEDDCAKQALVNAITYRKGDWDTSTFFKSLPKWMQKGAKDSKEGFPWTGPRGDGRLDKYKVPDQRGQTTRVLSDGRETHYGIGEGGKFERAPNAAAAQRKAAARPLVSTPRGKCFDMTRSPRRRRRDTAPPRRRRYDRQRVYASRE